MEEDIIRHYFKKGMGQGFSREYIRDALLKKGYEHAKVQYVFNSFIMEDHQQAFEQRQEAPRSRWKMFAGVFVLMLFAFGASFILMKAPGDAGVTGMVVQDAETRLGEINDLDQEIELKKQELQQRIEELQTKDLTIEEKNKEIHAIQEDLASLHQKVEQEHDQVRSLLWDLLKTLLRRGEEKYQRDAEAAAEYS